MRTIIVLGSILASLLGVGAVAVPAHAAWDGTEILHPTDGSTIKPGSLDLSVRYGDSYGYEITVDGPGSYEKVRYVYNPDPGETRDYVFGNVTRPGAYVITIREDYNYTKVATATVSVAAPPVELTDVSVRSSVFYPVVRDSYKDSVTGSYKLNSRAGVKVSVYRADTGRRVRVLSTETRSDGRHQWTWNGKNTGGNPVSQGRYRVRIDAMADDGTKDSASISVSAKTETVTRRGRESLNGNRARTSHRGNCYTNKSYYSKDVTLDCWGGSYAQAVYRFTVPATASNLRWMVRGRSGCCDRGSVLRNGQRVSPRVFQITVRATYWRSYTVNDVYLSYAYRKKI